MNTIQNKDFVTKVVSLLTDARQQVVRSVNHTMVLTYFEIGKVIVEEEQEGKERASYGKSLLKDVSKELTKQFGRGFSVRNLEQMRKFYTTYSISKTLSANLKNEKSATLLPNLKEGEFKKKEFNLSWSHYLTLIRIDDREERSFYEIESFKNNWSVRELKRQYDSALYTRLTLSRNKNEVKELAVKGQIATSPKDIIKDPYILEFIGLPEHTKYSESDLEQKLIDKLEHFLLELGNGFTFVARQKRISFDDKHFRIDLVFYNRILNCFVLIDLKIGDLKHQDIGQMQMYVNYYDRELKLDAENKTIGIILCRNKSESIVKYTLPKDNERIFASKYQTVLPTLDEFKSIIKE